ncbi:MAG: DUF3500 domain-containing protein [Desulfococcaceae bacterium]
MHLHPETPSTGSGGSHAVAPATDTAKRMAAAASAFLAVLSPDQRETAALPFRTDERFNWDYRPRSRAGLSLGDMDAAQRQRAMVLLATGLSRRGNIIALNIMALEKILGDLEGGGFRRDPERYHVTVFGTPSDTDPWGWRVEGHHLSVNHLIAKGAFIGPTPCFFGANPAEVPKGPLQGFRTLPGEESAARRLLQALENGQRKRAAIDDDAPADIVTRWSPRAKMDDPVGMPVSEMNEEQRDRFMTLLETYVTRMPEDVADGRMNALDRDGLGHIHFAWAGSANPGEPHYYRLHGPALLVEYDNTQNQANHIHSVWRDLRDDWGEDLLRRHYDRDHPGS